jgi:hypothetical protein
MPPGVRPSPKLPVMGRKSTEDHEMEEQMRAHVRQRMTQLRIGVTKAAELCGCDQGNLTKILLRIRGLGLGMAKRLISGLGMDAAIVFTVSPPEEFFRPYVPRAPDEDSGK